MQRIIFIVFFLTCFSNSLEANRCDSKFDFCGHHIKVEYDCDIFDSKLGETVLEDITTDQLNQLIKSLDNFDTEKILFQLNKYKSDFNFSDFDYFLLVRKFINNVEEEKYNNSRIFFEWFLLKSSGFDVSLRFSPKKIFIFGRTENDFSNFSNFVRGGKLYYELNYNINIGNNTKKFKTSFFEKKDNMKSINVDANYLTTNKVKQDSILFFKHKFKFEGVTQLVNIEYSYHHFSYFKMIPRHKGYRQVFNGSESDIFKHSIESSFGYLRKENDRVKSLNLLLAFCQSLSYKDDLDIRGYDYPSFPEEIFGLEFSDCEDRSILFSYLVKYLFGLETVLLEYQNPGHLNVGVKLEHDNKGLNYVLYNNDCYFICDPTSQNYFFGQQLDILKNHRYKIIEPAGATIEE